MNAADTKASGLLRLHKDNGPLLAGGTGVDISRHGKDYASNIKSMLGDKITLAQLPYRDLDLATGTGHTTTGLPYAMSGTATVVNQGVATHLASFQDPLKAIFGLRVEESKKVIVKRKYVVGGSAIVVPERAPARSVAVREDIREIELARYGADLEMNLNLFLSNDPSNPAETEFNMKLDAQKRALEQQLIELGYDEVMNKATRLDVALERAAPVRRRGDDLGNHVNAIYRQQLFGCMAKSKFAFQNILVAAKKANLYTPSSGTDNYSVMIVPNGMMDMDRYTKTENLTYNVSGVSHPSMPKITMPLENVYVDGRTNLRILQRPQPMDTTTRQAKANGGLLRDVTIRCWIGNGNVEVPDLVNQTWRSNNGHNAREITFKMSSAILCTDPGKCGELLMAFPMSAVSTSSTTETMRMQLRVYLGACLYDPEKVLIIPDIQFEGVVDDKLVTKKQDQCSGWSAAKTTGGAYRNTGPLGWLDYPQCGRVHGHCSYTDDRHRDREPDKDPGQLAARHPGSGGAFAAADDFLAAVKQQTKEAIGLANKEGRSQDEIDAFVASAQNLGAKFESRKEELRTIMTSDSELAYALNQNAQAATALEGAVGGEVEKEFLHFWLAGSETPPQENLLSSYTQAASFKPPAIASAKPKLPAIASVQPRKKTKVAK